MIGFLFTLRKSFI